MNKNVGIIKCGAFAADGVQNGHAFRLSYTVPTIPEIEKGIDVYKRQRLVIWKSGKLRYICGKVILRV